MNKVKAIGLLDANSNERASRKGRSWDFKNYSISELQSEGAVLRRN